MTQYFVLLPSDESRYAASTDQERADLHAAHNDFVRLLAERGHKLTGGAQLAASSQSRTVRGTGVDRVSVTEGPYAESTEQAGGFYTVETDDLDDLLKICGRLTATPFHTVIEVRPIIEM